MRAVSLLQQAIWFCRRVAATNGSREATSKTGAGEKAKSGQPEMDA